MKKILLLNLLILVSLTAFSQDDFASNTEIKTLIHKGAKIRGFMAFDMKLSDIHKYNSLLVGGHMGLILQDHLMIGGGGYGISSTNKFDGVDSNGDAQELYIFGGYGGIVLGYTVAPREIIHISFPVLIGGGGFEVSDSNISRTVRDQDFINSDHRVEYSSAFVVEPGVEAEINITKFFRLGFGGSYRIVQGVNLNINNITDKDLTSWSTHISFKFGKFW